MGIDGWAPFFVTEMAAALLAISMASLNPLPSDKAEARYPLKTSPAAVVSIACTLIVGIKPFSPFFEAK